MNIGTIVIPNTKGQVVIPKKIRDDLGIDPGTPLNMVVKADGLYLFPVVGVTTNAEDEMASSKLLDALEKTRGAWANEDWADYDKRQEQRKKNELDDIKRMKKAW